MGRADVLLFAKAHGANPATGCIMIYMIFLLPECNPILFSQPHSRMFFTVCSSDRGNPLGAPAGTHKPDFELIPKLLYSTSI